MADPILVVDCDADVTHWAPQIKAAGISGVMNYMRFLTRPMVDAYHAAGLMVAAIDEHGTNDVAGGAAAGAARGLIAATKLGNYGAPPTAASFVTIDEDISGEDDLDAAAEYFAAYDSKLWPDANKPALFLIAAYADGTALSFLRTLNLPICWLAGASGWSGSRAFALSGKPDLIQGPTIRSHTSTFWTPQGLSTRIACPALPFEWDPNIAMKPLDQIGFF